MQAEGFIQVEGVRLEYRWFEGDPSSPVIVMLHEGLGCLSMWKGFPETLHEQTGYGVFVYSRQGYGGSDACKLPRPVSYMHNEARVLKNVLNQLPAKTFILVGHSDGGSIASIFAGSEHGVTLSGLVLIAPHFFVEAVTAESIEKMKVAYRNSDLRARLQKYHRDQVDVAFKGWNDVWLCDEFQDWNICDYLPEIDCPTLVIQGDSDEYGSVEQMHTAERFINAPVTTRLFENCGHSAHVEYPKETTEEIIRFIDLTKSDTKP